MKSFFLSFLIAFTGLNSFAQQIDKIINAAEVERIERVLSSDDMQGRKTFTPGIEKAGNFIASEFKKSGLKYFDGLTSYHQDFSMKKATLISASGKINQIQVAPENLIAIATDEDITVDENSGYTDVVIDSSSNLMREAFGLINQNKKYIVWVKKSLSKS